MKKHIPMQYIRFSYVVPLTAMLLTFALSAQQPQYTQYMQNPVLFNAAHIGTLEGFGLTGSYRSQWTGIEDAPRVLSFVGEHKLNERVGLGLSILNDDFGPTAMTDVSAHFSYGVPLNANLNMRFSLTATGSFFSLNTDELSLADPTEDIFSNTDNSFSANAGIGFLLYADRWFLGLSAPTLFNTEDDDIAEGFRTNTALFSLTGGYRLDLGTDWAFKPSFLVQRASDYPTVYNLTGTVLFKDRISLGANYRNDETLSGLLGFWITNSIGIYYSYDYTFSTLGDVVNGSHEFILRFQLSSANSKPLFIGRN